jgi:hypothetical protein
MSVKGFNANTAPLLARSSNRLVLFSKEQLKTWKVLGLFVQSLFYKMRAWVHPSEDSIKALVSIKYRILHAESQVESLHNQRTFRKFLLLTTRNLPALDVMREKTDITVAEGLKANFRDLPIDELKTSEEGICAAMTYALAKKVLMGKDLYQAVAKFSKGADAKVSGRQALYMAVETERSQKVMEDLYSLESDDFPGTLRAEGLIAEIARQRFGVYRVTLRPGGTDDRHSILIHYASDETIYVVDPNIGLLRTRAENLNELFNKLKDHYQLGRLPPSEREVLMGRLKRYEIT